MEYQFYLQVPAIPSTFHSHNKKKKRGLFNLGGIVIGKLFGLATEDDVISIINSAEKFNDVLSFQGKLLEKH